MDFSKAKFDFVSRAKLWYTISLTLISIGIIAMIWQTVRTGFPLRRGIDFTGGSIIKLEFANWDESKNVVDFGAQITGLVRKYTEKEPSVQTSLVATESGTKSLILTIRADSSLVDTPEASQKLYDEIKSVGGDFTVLEESEVGALIGKELTSKAIWGVLIGNILILIYIRFRLAWDFAFFAVVGLIHDILIVTGIFALFNLEINSPFVAVLLTVVGYSINDTIIVYDRIRENMKVKRHLTFDKLVNTSLLETLARSINTSLTTLLAILAILIFGGASLRTFMIGLGAGIATGTYSSIFICAPLLVTWRLRGKGPVVIHEVRKAAPAAATINPDADLMEPEAEEEAEEEEEVAVEEIKVAKPTKLQPKKRPKKRRRRY